MARPDTPREAPAHLSERARGEWVRLAPTVAPRGEAALSVLSAYCQMWARWVDAEEHINKFGTVLKQGQRVVPSPYIGIASKALKQLGDLAGHLGLDTPKPTPTTTTVAAFARTLGVDESAVRKAIRNGRLDRSLGRDARGRVAITDVALATREWTANRDPAKARGPEAAAGETLLATTAAARRRVIEAQASRIEQDLDRRSGTLVPAREVETTWAALVVAARTLLLGLPTRARQRLPHLMASDLAVLDSLVREALEELANGAKGESA